MKKKVIWQVWQNYMTTILLLVGVVIGAICGAYFGESASIVGPLGDIFLNLMFVVVVPLIFFTITSSISKMKSPKRLGKIMITIFATFLTTSLISVLVGVFIASNIELIKVEDQEKIVESFSSNEEIVENNDMSILERTVSILTVNDFVDLYSKSNIIALLVVAILVGIAINMTGEKAKQFADFIESANEVLMNLIKLIMYYAPIGLGCYMASLVGAIGSSIAFGFLRTFVVYTVTSIVFFMLMYSIYALIAGGTKGLKSYWKNIFPVAVTSIATCSSAASIPVNVDVAKKIGVPNDIAETTVPLGTSFHKDGSIIGSVFKIMFLVSLFAGTMPEVGTLKIVVVALLATLLIVAVPVGGGTISEMLILTMMGFPMYSLPILAIIATIIDAPATLLNVTGDTASSMIVARIVDGKNWMNKLKILKK